MFQRTAQQYSIGQMELVIQHLTEVMFYIRQQDLQVKNYVLQIELLNQQKAEWEKQAVSMVFHEMLLAGIEQIRKEVLSELAIKTAESEKLSVQL